MGALAKNPGCPQSGPRDMITALVKNERLLTGFLFANVSLEGFRRAIHAVQPELNLILTVVQIVVGILTILHVIRKWRKRNEIVHADSP